MPMVMTADATAAGEVLWLDRRHPDYARYAPHWEFLRDSYNGGPEFVTNHLFRFWREKDPKYQDRLKRAYRYNFSRKVVDIITGYLWEQPPSRKRDALSPALQRFWENADREGNPIDVVMAQHVSPWACVYGRPWIVVDKPRAQATTKGQELRGGLFPYLTAIAPMDLLDARFSDGQLQWALVREWPRDDADPKTSSGLVHPQYRLWTTTTWELWEIQERTERREGHDVTIRAAVLLDQNAHGLGLVPIVPLDFKAPTSWALSPSLIWEIAYLDRSIFNHLSLLDEILYGQTFSQLAIPWQALMPSQGTPADGQQPDAAAGMRKHVAEMSTEEAFVYDASAGSPPGYVAPDSGPAATFETRIEREINELFRHLSLAGEMATEVSAASGVSKEHEFRKLNKLLATLADNHETAERRILRIAARWMGEDDSKIADDVVDYPGTFDVETLLDELEEIREMTTAGLPDVVVNEARKDVTQRRFSKLPPEKLKELLKAIDTAVGVPTMDIEAAVDAAMRRRREQMNQGGGGGGAGGGEET